MVSAEGIILYPQEVYHPHIYTVLWTAPRLYQSRNLISMTYRKTAVPPAGSSIALSHIYTVCWECVRAVGVLLRKSTFLGSE